MWLIWIGLSHLKQIVSELFNILEEIVIHCFVDSLLCIFVVFKTYHSLKNILIFYINFTLGSNNRCRDSTIFFSVTFIFTCILGLLVRIFILLNSFLLMNLLVSIGFVFNVKIDYMFLGDLLKRTCVRTCKGGSPSYCDSFDQPIPYCNNGSETSINSNDNPISSALH